MDDRLGCTTAPSFDGVSRFYDDEHILLLESGGSQPLVGLRRLMPAIRPGDAGSAR
jgi:hypothetical protein